MGRESSGISIDCCFGCCCRDIISCLNAKEHDSKAQNSCRSISYAEWEAGVLKLEYFDEPTQYLDQNYKVVDSFLILNDEVLPS